ncbi:ribose 5-phosphate isomerase A [Staphylococcus auricularis]|uniref:Ribose-5-phosphate isomerase A n=2 Tax=Staphylococcus auricularis TaxID=29379 RepID=A0AAW7ME85_9STAP|nr:ribose 5-phosphate isomerase A [Staphylococcus auricularis]MCG7341239.1 ribose 5-phosphate isomerase A [Staphylococcus auricularis]MDC6327645.1 ribose 5-phosphate isomerase A [Staphylococcus auricularis]MDN4533597.1 ribose 5-phosphate isomerase A [Staphylococcus auricularis]QPT07088.1 ribose 5-phosphate isomerase A [Staphylococcus auricularis]HJE00846.1 ribose 5-phosphate isomerase A [Staphylococcus auricularis]
MMDMNELKALTFDDAIKQIEDGMIVGIGSGSTIELLIPALAKQLRNQQKHITSVCTSKKTAMLVENEGIPVMDVNEVEQIHLAIDGADEVDPELNLIKGGGGALFREKVIDAKADRFIVLIDESKQVEYLGASFKLPVEVDQFNWIMLSKQLEKDLSSHVERRMMDDEPFVTDNGNYILDIQLEKPMNVYDLHEYLIHLVGVLETGLFLDVTDQVIVGTQQGVKVLNRE